MLWPKFNIQRTGADRIRAQIAGFVSQFDDRPAEA